MADDPNAGGAPAAPAAPAAATPAAPAPVIPGDVQALIAKRASLISDPTFRDRALGGNKEARAELSAIDAAIAAADSPNRQDAQIAHFSAEHLRSNGVSEATVQQYIEGKPIPESERALALQWKARHFADKGWLAKLADGDIDAVAKLRTCNVLLSLPTIPTA
jgi:hypothetical protein